MGIGALCHAMLPRCPDVSSEKLRPEICYRYVDCSIRKLARRFDELGARRLEVQVKLFGGADVLLTGSAVSTRATVGSLNCDAALEVLRAEGFKIAASSLRGKSGLSIRFDTSNGEVRLRRLKQCSCAIPPQVRAEGWGI